MGWTVGEKAQRPLTLVKLCLPVCWRFGSSLSGPPSWRRFVDDAPTPPDRSRAKHCDSRHEKRTTDGGVCRQAPPLLYTPRARRPAGPRQQPLLLAQCMKRARYNPALSPPSHGRHRRENALHCVQACALTCTLPK